jgi:hypothetical protein
MPGFDWLMLFFFFAALGMEVWCASGYGRDDPRWRVWGILANVIVFTVDLVNAIDAAVTGHLGGMILNVLGMIWAALVIWFLWRNWKGRKRVTDALGAKSRALREKVVRKMREVTVPSPAPVPA